MLWESEADCEELADKIMKMKDKKKRNKKKYNELQALLWESQDVCETELASARADLNSRNQEYDELQALLLECQGVCEELADKIMKMKDKKKRKT